MSHLSTPEERCTACYSGEGAVGVSLTARNEHASSRETPSTRIATGGFFRHFILQRLERIAHGRLIIREPNGEIRFGQRDSSLDAILVVHDRRFYRDIVLGGSVGAAEGYIRGHWDSPDLITTMRLLTQHEHVLTGVEHVAKQLLAPARSFANWLRRNTRAGSRRNIAAHYDLSNDLFALMLDPTMTHSSGVFPGDDATLQEASIEKYDRICRKLQLSSDDHVLEIGTGWGGFAEHAVRNYGCRITTTTISAQQHDYAKRRFQNGGLANKIELLKRDYRDLTGSYDKLVSIEMIEAVGEKFLPGYFRKCSNLLKPDGMMALQAITIPDHRFDAYRKSMDFIQRYIFPGGFLPSIGAIGACLAKTTDFRFFHSEDFGPHYARTLACWRTNFWNEIAAVRRLGFDERFIRTWHYYLCYCEAAFLEREVGVAQIVLTKPKCRREPMTRQA